MLGLRWNLHKHKKKRIIFFFLSQTFFMSTIEKHPAFFSLFPSHSVSFSPPPPPQPQDIWLFMSEGEKQQVWGSAPNTREVIQFRVGSKSCGRLCTARSGAQRGAGWMHIRCRWWRLADACPWFWGVFLPGKNMMICFYSANLDVFTPPVAPYMQIILVQCCLLKKSGYTSLPGCTADAAGRVRVRDYTVPPPPCRSQSL